MSIRIIDSHCHLDMGAFDEDRDEVIKRAREAGVEGVIMPATMLDDFEKERTLSTHYKGYLFYLVGVHPHEARTATSNVYDEAIKHLETEPGCVGIGEIGLDYYYEHSPRKVQRDVFANFLDLAIEIGKPVSIHCRDATDDVVDILSSKKDLKGVIHCFSGDEKLLRLGLDLGLKFGIGGIVTFKRSPLADTVGALPLESVVFETDAPYLAPVPKRGKRNEPAFLTYIVERFADLKGVDADVVSRVAFENTVHLFGLKLS